MMFEKSSHLGPHMVSNIPVHLQRVSDFGVLITLIVVPFTRPFATATNIATGRSAYHSAMRTWSGSIGKNFAGKADQA